MPEEVGKSPLKIEPGDKKVHIREKMWDYIRDNNLASFPKPPHRRIPNFVGSDEAGDLVTSLDVFKNANNVRIDPDRPLLQIRLKTLEAGKALFLPTPGMVNHVLSKVVIPVAGNKRVLRSCMTRDGVLKSGELVDIDSVVHIDLIIVGCVAVSPQGWRIGKGSGLSDIEYAMMCSTGSIDSSTPVITVAHDCQVLDLPTNLFTSCDVPTDYIVTPTRVIRCADHHESVDVRPTKPVGLIWSLLNSGTISHLPVLRRLRYREWKAGKQVYLAGESAETALALADVIEPENRTSETSGREGNERRSKSRYSRPRRNGSRRAVGKSAPIDDEKSQTNSADVGNDKQDAVENKRFSGNRRSQVGRRRKNADKDKKVNANDHKMANGLASDNDVNDNQGGDNQHTAANELTKQRNDNGKGESTESKVGRRRFDYQNSVYVGALPYGARVSEFKAEIRERKVNPVGVLWRGSSGFAFLSFKTVVDAEAALQALSGLQVNDKVVRLEMAHAAASRPGAEEGPENETRQGRRRRRNARPVSSDAGESVSKASAPQHQSEGNVASENNLM